MTTIVKAELLTDLFDDSMLIHQRAGSIVDVLKIDGEYCIICYEWWPKLTHTVKVLSKRVKFL